MLPSVSGIDDQVPGKFLISDHLASVGLASVVSDSAVCGRVKTKSSSARSPNTIVGITDAASNRLSYAERGAKVVLRILGHQAICVVVALDKTLGACIGIKHTESRSCSSSRRPSRIGHARFRGLALVLFLTLTNGQLSRAATPLERVVSLDFCADQFVLKILPRASILALSPDAEKAFSYMRSSATGIPSVRPVAEDVLAIEPALIVRSYGGGPHASRFFKSAGVPVVQIPFSNDLEQIRRSIRSTASALSAARRGEEIVEEMDARLARLDNRNDVEKSSLYMTPTGVTSGSGTVIDEMIRAAGLSNFQLQPGWRSLPLERLAYERPDIVAAGFFDATTNHPAMWSAMRHPVARQQIRELPTTQINGAWTACGGWFLLDAIEALAATSSPRSAP